MDTSDNPDVNDPGANAPASSPRPESDPFFFNVQSTARPTGSKPRGLMRRLAGRFWQLLLLWLVITFPVWLLIYHSILPTYEAASLLHFDPAPQELFAPINRAESANSTYLQTQATLIGSDKVLDAVLADASVINLPAIKKSQDPKIDLRAKLRVVIIDGTNLIRVSLELPDPDEAAAIVKAVVQSYITQNIDYSRSYNRELMESLRNQLEKLGKEIKLKRAELKTLYLNGRVVVPRPEDRLNAKTETDPTQLTFKILTEEQFAKLTDRMLECDLEYLEALSHLEAAKLVRERNLDQINEELDTWVAEEFRKDPRVAAILDQIDEYKKLGQSKDSASSPAVLAACEKQKQLSDEYKALLASRRPGIRKRLAQGHAGILSDAKIQELEVAVEKARRKKGAFAQQFEKIHIDQNLTNDDTLEAAYLQHQLSSLQNGEEQVKKNLAQLSFEAAQDKYRVTLYDPAYAPRTPTNNTRLKCMGAAPMYVFLLLLGLFLVQEIKAGRNGTTGFDRIAD